jgi:hypothetical protein
MGDDISGIPAPRLAIEYAVTLDDAIDGGVVVPGIIGDGIHWGLVKHDNGTARWRRIYLSDEALSPPSGASWRGIKP